MGGGEDAGGVEDVDAVVVAAVSFEVSAVGDEGGVGSDVMREEVEGGGGVGERAEQGGVCQARGERVRKGELGGRGNSSFESVVGRR